MTHSGSLIFLGTGNTEGIPSLFCHCSICQARQIERLRPSVLITWGEKRFIIDISPDFRQQALRAKIDRLDGIFLTHPHYDHIGGLDDLRSWYLQYHCSLPVILSSYTYEYLSRTRTHLVSKPRADQALSAAEALDFHCVQGDYGEGKILGFPYTYVSYYQKQCKVTGFRFGNLAYLTDMSAYDEEIFNYLKGVETLIISVGHESMLAAFPGRSPSHLNLQQIKEFVALGGIRRYILTHIGHHLQEHMDAMPEDACAYDGMEVSWSL